MAPMTSRGSRQARHRILHPTDFSPASRAAFAKALKLAGERKAELTLLHVRSLVAPMAGEGYMSARTYEQLERAAEAEARGRLARLVGKARRKGVRARGLLAQGIAHEEIARAARRDRAEMIVMGTHGRTGLPRFFLGSVAGRVVSVATCPVLTVRGK